MNCNELMIGDWFLASEQHSTMDGDYTLEFYPKKLTLDDLLFARDNDWNELDWNEFTKPILLTAEILEKNGFDWVEDEDELSNSEYEGYMALYSDEEIRFYSKGSMDRYCALEIGYIERTYIKLYINYVHELQHALRLCGLNDLADNFKIK